MAVTDLPLVQMLKTRMHWHQTRQKLLSETMNGAASCTPSAKPRPTALMASVKAVAELIGYVLRLRRRPS